MPLPTRWLSSVLLRQGRQLILFDCGEGTQISLRSLGWGLKAIDLILISHLHGDHVTGLPGLMLTLGNSGRIEPVRIVGPVGLRDVVQSLLVVAPYLPFELRIDEQLGGETFQAADLHIRSTAGDHHVSCLAYRLDLPRAPRFLPERAEALGVPLQHWARLQRGETVAGIAPDQVLGPARPGLSVGLVTDTRPTDDLARLVREVDLLVCEATFGDDADQQRAVERKHMTFREAAILARQAEVRQLLLTHFSTSVADPEAFASNARDVFPATIVGRDHLSLQLTFTPD